MKYTQETLRAKTLSELDRMIARFSRHDCTTISQDPKNQGTDHCELFKALLAVSHLAAVQDVRATQRDRK